MGRSCCLLIWLCRCREISDNVILPEISLLKAPPGNCQILNWTFEHLKLRSIESIKSIRLMLSEKIRHDHGLRTPGEKNAFTERPKFRSHSQILRYGRSIFCLPHWPIFSDFFDSCLHWVSVVCGRNYQISDLSLIWLVSSIQNLFLVQVILIEINLLFPQMTTDCSTTCLHVDNCWTMPDGSWKIWSQSHKC